MTIGEHLDKYAEIGRPYITKYSLTDDLSWVLCMSPFMATTFAKAEFVEVDITYQVSQEFPYLMNVITFDHTTMLCK